MKRKTITFCMVLAILLNLLPSATATEIGATSITDKRGTVYTLSKAVLDSTTITFHDDLEADAISTVTVYLVPMDTVVTLPSTGSCLARWYAPDEAARGGWSCFVESGLIPAGEKLPFDVETVRPDGTIEMTSNREDAVLRLYSAYNMSSIYIRGVDTPIENPPHTTAGMDNFQKTGTYSGFSDVPSDAWYINDVTQVCELGLMNGKSADKFDPNGTLTLAEAVTVAARINSIYHGSDFVSGGNPWYSNAVTYAIDHGIVSKGQFLDFTKLATRTDFANILYKSIPSDEFTQINQVDQIPDVTPGSANAEIIYSLYQAGVLTGGSDGSFKPNDSITRSEVAAIINRVVLPENRIKRMNVADTSSKIISNANEAVVFVVPSGSDWEVKKDKVNEKNGTSEFYYQSKDGRAVIRTFVIPKSSAPNASVSTVATTFKDDCVKQGSVIGENGIYDATVGGFSGLEFEYSTVNSKGITWTGKFGFFEYSERIYGVQRETSERCKEKEINELLEIYDSITVVG